MLTHTIAALLLLSQLVHRFEAGQCIAPSDPSDRWVWKIARIEHGRYVVMGWVGNGWGNETRFQIGHFESLRFETVECPQRRV